MRREPEAMDCAAVDERLEAYVDGSLEAEERRRLEAHLAEHPPCAERVLLAERVRDGLRALPELDLTPAALARIKARGGSRVRPIDSRPRHRFLRPRLWRLAAAAAAVIVATGVGLRLARAPLEQPGPTAAEVTRATVEVRTALALVARASLEARREVGERIGSRRLARPILEGFDRSLEPLRRRGLQPGATTDGAPRA